MPAKTAERRKISATIAAIQRHNGADDPRLPGLERNLAIERYRERIDSAVEDAPSPLPYDVAQRSIELIRAASRAGAA